MVSSINNNQNSYPGLKVGAGVTALAATSAFGTPKFVDKMTAYVAKSARETIATNNKTIKDTLKSMTEAEKNMFNPTKMKELGNQLIDAANASSEKVYNSAKTLFKSRKVLKNINLKKSFAMAVPFYLGAGALVDWANNRQRANSEPNAETKNGNEYVKTNMGKKLGAFLGVACNASLLLINKPVRNLLPKSNIISGFINAAVGGFILGAITDKMSNRNAAKQADRNV